MKSLNSMPDNNNIFEKKMNISGHCYLYPVTGMTSQLINPFPANFPTYNRVLSARLIKNGGWVWGVGSF